MKKRLVALVSTALLVVCMSMTAFAAQSPSADKVEGTGSTTGTSSPTTGEPISLMVAGAAVVIGAAGVVVTSKKRA